LLFVEQTVAEKQRRKNKDVFNPLAGSDQFEILYHEITILNGTCLDAGDIAIAIVNGKEDSADNHNHLEYSSCEFMRNGIQTNGNENRNEEQPVSTEQLKLVIPISANKVNNDIVCKKTKADVT
jgi:hypothetical protein